MSKYPMWLNIYNAIVVIALVASLWVFPGHFWRNLGIAFACSFVVTAIERGFAAARREREKDAETATAISDRRRYCR